MPYAIVHFSAGVVGSLIILYSLGLHRHPYVETGYAAIIGGFLGMAPDVWWFVPIPREIHDSAVSNLFFGHHFLDHYVEPLPPNQKETAAIAVVILGLAVVLCYLNEVQSEESERIPAGSESELQQISD